MRNLGFFLELGFDDAPMLADEIDTLSPDDIDRLVPYLASAPVLVAASGAVDDLLSGEPRVAADQYHTDGQWVWPAVLGYYVERYAVSLPADFVEHVRGQSQRGSCRPT